MHQGLKDKTLDGFLVSNPGNRHYLTGWPADAESGYLLITTSGNYLFTDSRYSEQATSVANFELIDTTGGFAPKLSELVKEKGLARIGFESHDLSVFDLRRIKKFVKAKFVPVAHLIEEARAIKDRDEIELIRRAVNLDQKAFEHILGFVKPGQTEGEVAWELEKKLKELGAERAGWFPFIVAAGANSSIPHYGNSPTAKIKVGDILQLDYASVVDSYHSDTSRVIFIGKPDPDQVKVYNWVREAQELGESLVKPGAVGGDIDRKVRGFLAKQTGFYFKHGLGHGVGLEIHELPRVSPGSRQKLQVGNCLTVEPGIYRPGWGGVRLEDIVVVTEKGCEVLTKTTKKISEITI